MARRPTTSRGKAHGGVTRWRKLPSRPIAEGRHAWSSKMQRAPVVARAMWVGGAVDQSQRQRINGRGVFSSQRAIATA